MNTMVSISKDELNNLKNQVTTLTKEAVRLMGKIHHLTAKSQTISSEKQQALQRADKELQTIAEQVNMSEEEADNVVKEILTDLHGVPH